MLPKFLYGSYKRYKSDTTAFVDWLIDAAKNCGSDGTTKEPDISSKGSKHKIDLRESADSEI